MAMAHLLEHADPDRTPISNLPDNPPRFIKDVGRAISLWWLAREQVTMAGDRWLEEWRRTLAALYPNRLDDMKQATRTSLAHVADYLRDAHLIALNGVLAPHGTTLEAFRRAHASLRELVEQV